MFRFTSLAVVLLCVLSVVGCDVPASAPPQPPIYSNDNFGSTPFYMPDPLPVPPPLETPSFTPPSFEMPSVTLPPMAPPSFAP